MKSGIKIKPSVQFVLLFGLAAALSYVALSLMPEAIYGRINHLNAQATGWVLNVFGVHVDISGELILHKGFKARVVGECSAVFISVLPFSFFLSYPAPPVLRAAGILMGLPLLFGVNILRIVLVFMVGLTRPDLFAWVHLYIGQIFMILVVIWICMVWLKWINRGGRGMSSARFVFLALVFSLVPFVAWIWLSRPYTWAVLFLAEMVLGLTGFEVSLPKALDVYPHLFISFNIVVLFSMVLADRVIQKKLNLKKVIWGFLALVGLHTLFQILPLLFFQHQIRQSGALINALLLIHQFVLPFVLWLVLMPLPGKEGAKRRG